MASRSSWQHGHFFDPHQLQPILQHRVPLTRPMQALGPVFERLELSVYTAVFTDNGFETWEDVLDITENDL